MINHINKLAAISLTLIGALEVNAAIVTLTTTQAGRWTFAEPLVDLGGGVYDGGAWNNTDQQTPFMNDIKVGFSDGSRMVSMVNFTALPGNLGTINSAKLWMYCDWANQQEPGTGLPSASLPLTTQTFSAVGNWSAATPIANIPATNIVGGTNVITNAGGYGWYEFDVKTVVADWSSQANTSIRLGAPAGPGYPQILQFKASGVDAPYITLDYTAVPEPASLALLALSAVALLRRRRA